MTPPRVRPAVPAIALRQADAAGALGMGPTFFRDHVAPELRTIRIKSKVLYPVEELARWAREHMDQTL